MNTRVVSCAKDAARIEMSWVRLIAVSAVKFGTAKLAGMVAVAVNGPTCAPPVPVNA